MNQYLEFLNSSPELFASVNKADEGLRLKWAARIIDEYKGSDTAPASVIPGFMDLFFKRLSSVSLFALVNELLLHPIEPIASENYQQFLVALYYILPISFKRYWLRSELALRPMIKSTAYRYAQGLASMKASLVPTVAVEEADLIEQKSEMVVIEGPDLNVHPGSDAAHPAHPRAQLTIGDLHGNVVKLIHFLVYQNVMIISTENYAELVKIYYRLIKNLDVTRVSPAHKCQIKKDIQKFDAILQADDTRFNTVGLVRLIGDVFGDRGCCDLLTARVLACLRRAEIPLKVLISNHDLAVIQWLEAWLMEGRVEPCDSLTRMLQLINLGLVSEAEIKELLDYCYKPALRLVDYAVNADKTRVNLFTHAPIQIETIEAIAQRLGVLLRRDSVENFLASLDEINFIFQIYVQTNMLRDLFREAVMSFDPSRYNLRANPFTTLVWNKDPAIERLPSIAGCELLLFHGHEKTNARPGFVGLDGDSGRESDLHNLKAFTKAELADSRLMYFMRYAIVYSEYSSGPFSLGPLPDLSRVAALTLSALSFFAGATIPLLSDKEREDAAVPLTAACCGAGSAP